MFFSWYTVGPRYWLNIIYIPKADHEAQIIHTGKLELFKLRRDNPAEKHFFHSITVTGFCFVVFDWL